MLFLVLQWPTWHYPQLDFLTLLEFVTLEAMLHSYEYVVPINVLFQNSSYGSAGGHIEKSDSILGELSAFCTVGGPLAPCILSLH